MATEEPGMRQPPALDMSSNVTKILAELRLHRRAHLQPGRRSRPGLFADHAGTAPAADGDPERASLLASVRASGCSACGWSRRSWSKLFFTSWAACTFVFVAVGAVLDGGVRSPISYFLILPMLFAGLAYSAGTVSFLAGFGVITSSWSASYPDRSWSTTAFLAVGDRDRRRHHRGGGGAAGPPDAPAGGRGQPRRAHRMPRAGGRSRSAWITSRCWRERHDAIFSLVVADLDNLKALNDSNGHHYGDRALRLLASVLRQAARGTDVVGRLGGDEFAAAPARDRSGGGHGRGHPAARRAARRDGLGLGHGQHRGQHVVGPERRPGRAARAGPTRRSTWPSGPGVTAPPSGSRKSRRRRRGCSGCGHRPRPPAAPRVTPAEVAG